MKSKSIVPREAANWDVDEAIAHYLGEDVRQAALGFIKALEQAYLHVGRHPATGSPRYAHEINLPAAETLSVSGVLHRAKRLH
jgi:toxin ParE1/3/4